MSIAQSFQTFLIETKKVHQTLQGKEHLEKLSEAVKYVKEREGIHQEPCGEGCIRVDRAVFSDDGIKGWKWFFNKVGVKNEDILEFRLVGLPDGLKEFEGLYVITAGGVTEEEYRAIIAFELPYTEADSIERTVLHKLRGAYELLQDARTLIDNNQPLLRKCNSFMDADWLNQYEGDSRAFNYCGDGDVLDAAINRIDVLGGDLYAKRETPCLPVELDEDGNELEPILEAHLELEDTFREAWLNETPSCIPEHYEKVEQAAGQSMAEQLQENHDKRVSNILRAVGILDACMSNLTDSQREEVVSTLKRMQGYSPTARRLTSNNLDNIENVLMPLS